jgi:hypothetical protein
MATEKFQHLALPLRLRRLTRYAEYKTASVGYRFLMIIQICSGIDPFWKLGDGGKRKYCSRIFLVSVGPKL